MSSRTSGCFLWNLTLVITAVLTLSACGGGGSTGGGDNNPTQSPSSPTVTPSQLALEILLPLNNSSIRGVSELTVSGRLSDEQDGELNAGDVSTFEVNGVEPTLDMSTGKWSVLLNFTESEEPTQISARAVNNNGDIETAEIYFASRSFIPRTEFLNVLGDDGSVLVLGSGAMGILNPLGEQRVVIGVDEPNSPEFVETLARGAALDENGEHAYAIVEYRGEGPIYAKDTLISVNLQTAEVLERGTVTGYWSGQVPFKRYIDFDLVDTTFAYSGVGGDLHADEDFGRGINRCWLSTLDIESGAANELIMQPVYELDSDDLRVGSFCPGALLLDLRENRVIVAHSLEHNEGANLGGFAGIYTVDLSTGTRTAFSNDTRGSGPAMSSAPTHLFFADNGVSILAITAAGIFKVELASGDRQLLLAEPVFPADSTSFSFDETNQRLLIASDNHVVSSLDLASGTVETLYSFNNAVGSGVEIAERSHGLLDSAENRLLYIDRDDNMLKELDLANLERRNLYAVAARTWTDTAPILDTQSNSLYYEATALGDSIRWLDLATGVQRLATGLVTGEGVRIRSVEDMCIDQSQSMLYVVGDYELSEELIGFPPNGVISVDIATGDRRLVSSEDQALPEHFEDVDFILCDTENARLLVTDQDGAIQAVDPSTGERSLLVAGIVGRSMFDRDRGFQWDSEPGRVLIQLEPTAHSSELEVRSVDLATGEYEVVARNLSEWIYDPAKELFYARKADDFLESEDGLRAIKRVTGEEVVISHPR